MRIGILLGLLMAGVAFCTEPAAAADSSQQSMQRQAVNSGLPLPPRPTPDTLCLPDDTSRMAIPCALALGAWDAIGRGRACDETAPCLALGFVLTICLLLVLNGIMHH
jgi:hypothetical protein